MHDGDTHDGEMDDGDGSTDTSEQWYADRLVRLSGRSWKRLLPNPYARRIRRLGLGRMLDVGCGIGRNLVSNGGRGVGVDHSPAAVEQCRRLGLEAYTPEEFDAADPGVFDSMLLSHVLEHTTPDEGRALLERYLPRVRPGGLVVLMTPQAAGQRSDPTHVRPIDREALARELRSLGVEGIRTRSFPFPPFVGRVFRHNENEAVGRIPGGVRS